MRRALLALTTCVFAACTWVEPDAGGSAVRVAYGKDLSGCTEKGRVTVSVKHQVAGYRRNDLKVRDELESLARNEAASMGADTIQALEEPLSGEQKFGVYVCR